MTASKSMPLPAAPTNSGTDSRIIDKSDLIDRLATEMRVKSGGELPLSFCIAQVKRQLAGKQSESSAANNKPAATARPAVGSVFHSWAMRD
ncbi:hypothetical protein [Aliirhizobium smilacinae]|uniref:Uncharacterized protein n=1 Tax=Aliirhizobium smilacinae TaxID=1395944 RepID=A0A5C4XHZ2_9HYPH|nr:hypothetical protein [Rhizobium smilacinae]TNM62982.1 hypothetical protein FHP24_17360 [Rhizobium smilacinae]